jgi:hypothetical protein
VPGIRGGGGVASGLAGCCVLLPPRSPGRRPQLSSPPQTLPPPLPDRAAEAICTRVSGGANLLAWHVDMASLRWVACVLEGPGRAAGGTLCRGLPACCRLRRGAGDDEAHAILRLAKHHQGPRKPALFQPSHPPNLPHPPGLCVPLPRALRPHSPLACTCSSTTRACSTPRARRPSPATASRWGQGRGVICRALGPI